MTIDSRSLSGRGWLIVGLFVLAPLSLGMGKRPPERAIDESKEVSRASREIVGGIEVIERLSGENVMPDLLGKKSKRLHEATKMLEQNMERATPQLVDCFTNTHNNRDARMLCSNILQRDVSNITPQQQERFLMVVEDQKEHELPRIDAAVLLLRSMPKLSDAIRKEIKGLVFRIYKEGKYQSHLRMSVFNALSDDSEVEDFLIDQLRTEPDNNQRDAILNNLAKRKYKGIIPIVEGELNSPVPEKMFSKVRLYFALGDVGGNDAARILIRQLGREINPDQQDHILRALGATKAADAKGVLLEYLSEEKASHHVAALDGLKYLGDNSVLEYLEEYLKRGNISDYRRSVARGTIEAIRQGHDATFW